MAVAVEEENKRTPFLLDEMVMKKKKKKSKKRKITWIRAWDSMDIRNVVFISFVHVLCLFAPFTFSWSAFWLAFSLYHVCGNLGTTLSYHRNLAHKSYNLPKYLEYFFAYLGLHANQGDPIWWVSTHRYHHKYVDTNRDPHSPVEGFWFSHFFWLFDNDYVNQKGGKYANVADLMKQSYYRFLNKTVVLHAILQAVVLYAFGGFPFVVWGMGVRTTIEYHATWLVNSACHTWGYQTWNTGDLSKNNWFIALFVFGEGWHNNHHAFEYSARHGLEWWQMDTTWYVIKLLEYFGLATDIKVPSEIHMQKMSLRTGETYIKKISSNY